jgi:acyl-CoA reductase-like NAD-dependent aldehyde dehydrogenase
LATYAASSPEAVRQAVHDARQAQITWQQVPLARRAQFLRDVADAMESQADRLAAMISDETGKSIKDAHETDLMGALATLRWVAAVAAKTLAPRWTTSINSLSLGLVHQHQQVAKVVVGVISPWNVPLAIPVGGLAPALVAGNAVVLKPSEHTPGTALLLVEILQRLLAHQGYPPGLVQVVLGDGRVGQAVTATDIDHLVFTGSHRSGLAAYAAMASRGATATLELGGNDPMVVLPDADLDWVTSTAMWSRCYNAGQTCAAVKRLIVPAEQHIRVVDALLDKFKFLKIGPPSDPTCHIGPLISADQRNVVHRQVQQAVAQGGQVCCGGQFLAPPGAEGGYYYAPTLITDLPAAADMLQAEIFGPVLLVQTYQTVDEAVALANQSPYGLGASVFGPTEQAMAVAARLQAGVVTVNEVPGPMFALPMVPWTGHKASGMGVGHSTESLLACCHLRSVTVSWRHVLPWFKKAPWLFGECPDAAFAPVLRQAFGNLTLRSKCRLDLLLGLWRNRSSQKL